MLRYYAAVLLMLSLFTIHVSAAQTPIAQIILENRLVAEPSMKADAAPCQPQRGTAVKRLRTQRSINGIDGLDVVKVKILDGSCRGELGWIADALLQSAHTPSQ